MIVLPPALTEERVALDVLDVIGRQMAVAVFRRGDSSWWNGARSELMNTFSGAMGYTQQSSPDRGFWGRMVSAVGTINSRYFEYPSFPIGTDRTLDPPVGRLPLEWKFRLLVNRRTPLVNNAGLFVGAHQNIMSSPFGTTTPCYGLGSQFITNGGDWQVYIRQANAGPLTRLDTPFSSTQTRLIELTYRDTIDPMISLAIDGVVVDTRVGLAAIPVPPLVVNGWYLGYAQGFTVGGTAGQIDLCKNARLTVTELAGYPR